MMTSKILWIETFAALTQRLIAILTFVLIFKISLPSLALKGDGDSYLYIAQGLLSWDFSQLIGTSETQFFIGYPVLLSFPLLFLPPWAAGYTLQALCVLGVLYVGNKVFEDRWIMRFFVFCLPSFVFFTCINMSEAWIVFLLLAALWMFLEKKWKTLALIIAIATITRPQTCFFFYVPVFLWFFCKKEWKALFWFVIFPSLFFGGMLCFNYVTFENPFINFKSYNSASEGGILSLPLKNLWVSTFNAAIPLWKKIYVWVHVLFVLGGLGFLWREMRLKKYEAFYVILFGWAFSHTLFYLSVSSWWGFQALPRYLVPIFPAIFLGYGQLIPRKGWVIAILSLACIGISILSLRL